MGDVGTARVGCSGWMYRHWRGPVYPESLPQRRWFEHYAALLGSVEVNNTFYRLPTEAAVEGWAAQAPPGFTYALKLGAFGSHRMKLRDAASWLPNHLDRLDRLGPTAGPTLVQLPPRWKRNAERLDEFLSVAPSSRRWAVELRERSWLHEDVFAVLRRHGAALCVHDLLADHPWELTADWAIGLDAIMGTWKAQPMQRSTYGSAGTRRAYGPGWSANGQTARPSASAAGGPSSCSRTTT